MATFEEFLNAVRQRSGIKFSVQALSRDPFVKLQFTAAAEDESRLVREIINERVVDYSLYHDYVGYFYPPVYEGKLPIPRNGYCLGAVCYMTILPGTCGLTINHPAFYRQPLTAKYALVPSVYCDNSKMLLASLRDTHDIQDIAVLEHLQRLKDEHPSIYHKIVTFAKTFRCGYDPDNYDPIEIPSYKSVAAADDPASDDED